MLGAQGTVCAGGRYDKLVEQMGGKSTPAVGLAMGVERLILLLDEADLFPDSIAKHIDIYVIMDSDVSLKALELSSYIRESCPFLRLQSHCGGGSLKNKIKKADKSGAQLALIISDEEVIVDNITIKFLRQDCPQMTVNKEELVKLINNKDINLNIN
jgi:histidyl-tRNA synthetase